MADEAYDRLANALDALPNRFPRTKSGVEIKILKWLYTPEQADVFSYLSRTPLSTEELAEKSGLPLEQVQEAIAVGASGILSVAQRRFVDGQEKFRLGPFVLGIYEGTVETMDKEFAELFEKYMFEEGAAKAILEPQPGILGVVPVRGSVKRELLEPYEDIDAHFEKYERFMVMNCICRVQQNLLGSTCPTPVRRCAFVGLPAEVPVSEGVLDRETAVKLFDDLEQQGCIHLGFYGHIMGGGEPQFMGCCTCCADCCGIMRGITEMGLAEAPTRSNYRAVLKVDECIACGDCIQRCQVKAITEDSEGMPVFNREKCIGCGQCVIACPVEAVEMEKLPEAERVKTPGSVEEWEEARMRNMGWIT